MTKLDLERFEKLREPLKSLRFWLKRLEGSRYRQSLLKEAREKIQRLRLEHQYVNSNEVLSLPNKTLHMWIHRKLVSLNTAQTTLERFF